MDAILTFVAGVPPAKSTLSIESLVCPATTVLKFNAYKVSLLSLAPNMLTAEVNTFEIVLL